MDLRLLGPVAAYVAGEPLALGGPRQRAVLAALLLKSNEPVPTEHLIRAVWEDPPASASANIRTYVAGLRRVLRAAGAGERLATWEAGYRFVVESGELDVVRFADLTGQGRHELSAGDLQAASAHFTEALGLWRGRPLAGAAASSWLLAEATRLEELRLTVVEQVVDVDLALGRHAELITELRRLVAEHPLRERFWAQLMLALYRQDRQADALAAYAQLRARLAEELGLDPGPEVRRLHARILGADPALLTESAFPESALQTAPARGAAGGAPRDFVPPRQLPLSSVTFTGRDKELGRVKSLLRTAANGPVVISAIDGAGGIGKSALAIRAASELAEHFPDGQLYVDLQGATAGLSPLAPGEVLGRFLRALGMPGNEMPASREELTVALRSRLAGKRLLMVLDNAADAEQVRPLLPSGKGCAVVVTSRRVLATLEGAEHLHLDVLPRDEAVMLLGRLAGGERVEAERDAAADIARLCGRLPLALRVAGARLAARPAWSLHAFAERLSDTHTRLDQLEAGDLAVRASLRVSLVSLRGGDDPHDQTAVRAFRLVGLLDGPEVGILAVAALLDESPGVAEIAMERLADARLVEATGVGRYRFHDLVRLFARELALEEEPGDDAAAALDRAMSYYLATTQRAVRLLDPIRQWPVHPVDEDFAAPIRDRAAAIDWLEAERVNLVAAVVQAGHQGGSIAPFGPGLAGALLWFLMPRMYLDDLRTVGEAATRIARRLGDRTSEAWGLEITAFAHHQAGRNQELRRCLESAYAIWQETGDRDGEQRTLCNLSVVVRLLGDSERSIALLRRQIPIAREIGNQVGELVGLLNLGESYGQLGQTTEALTHVRAALEMAHAIGDQRNLAGAVYEIGKLYLSQGRLSEARAHMRQALPRLREVGDRENEAELLIMLSRTCRMLGDLDEALACCERGLGLLGKLGSWRLSAEAIHERDRVLAAIADSR
ncbi:MAG TPA: BTAD domain-containing putative transcriptional regulator [Streptosporangiaceae bacterium]|nr:BTAD domain-containing putative transcriptional regulator [Streptosporangiaceae bacterium]